MKVFIVVLTIDYEGDSIIGVFKNEKKADKHAETINKSLGPKRQASVSEHDVITDD